LDLFEVILSIHIGLGVICLLSGMVSMLAAKKKGRHSKWGEVYHGAYAALATTAIMLAIWKCSTQAKMDELASTPYSRYAGVLYRSRYRAACEYWRQYSAVKQASRPFILVFTDDYWQSAYLRSHKTL
jgi:hypothetical protein